MKMSKGVGILYMLLLAVLVSTVMSISATYRINYQVDLLGAKQSKLVAKDKEFKAELFESLEKTKFICRLPADLNAKLDDFDLDVVPAELKKILSDAAIILFTESEIRDDKVYQVVTKIYFLEKDVRCGYLVGQSYGKPLLLNNKRLGASAIHEGEMVIYKRSSKVGGYLGRGDRSMYIYVGRLAFSDLPVSYVKRVIESGEYKKQANGDE